MKQVEYVNYTLNEFKDLSKVLGNFMFVDNCQPQSYFGMFCMLGNLNIIGSKFFLTEVYI